MKVEDLHIQKWRNFRSVRLQVPPHTPLVCLVGENGTGKSNILELLSAAASRLGISSGLEMPRGDPFQEEHEFCVTVNLPDEPRTLLSEPILQEFGSAASEWNQKISLHSWKKGNAQDQIVKACGVRDEYLSREFASTIVHHLGKREDTQHLHLDADRAYPPFQLPIHQYIEALGQQWDSPEFLKQWSFRPTRELYEQWMQYFLARESRFATEFANQSRRAKDAAMPPPEFVDIFAPYKEAVRTVLPHLIFVGVDTDERTILFDTAGVELSFSKLSGGEREIAFIIGQIERFRLRRGLLLLDEPELHLNPDLVRTWLAYIRDTVEEGQVWIATHSLEAVEVAGHESTFIMERTGATRTVERISALGSRPVISTLSVALGAPAFSLANLRFIFIEGERQTKERERFFRICGDAAINRFLEGGSCKKVIQKLQAVAELAKDTGDHLHVGRVIDRDFRTGRELTELQRQYPVHVLECHEVENLFLHPCALKELLRRSGRPDEQVRDILLAASDRFAGLWILQRAATRNYYLHPDLPAPSPGMRQLAGTLKWSDFTDQPQEKVSEIVARGHATKEHSQEVANSLNKSVEAYARLRTSTDLWKRCLGKQVFGHIPPDLDLSDADALERQVGHLWKQGHVARPPEAQALIAYVRSISPSLQATT